MKAAPLYFVRRIDFDGTQTDIAKARTATVIAYFSGQRAADAFAMEWKAAAEAKRGWDGEEYPRFESCRADAIASTGMPEAEQ